MINVEIHETEIERALEIIKVMEQNPKLTVTDQIQLSQLYQVLDRAFQELTEHREYFEHQYEGVEHDAMDHEQIGF